MDQAEGTFLIKTPQESSYLECWFSMLDQSDRQQLAKASLAPRSPLALCAGVCASPCLARHGGLLSFS